MLTALAALAALGLSQPPPAPDPNAPVAPDDAETRALLEALAADQAATDAARPTPAPAVAPSLLDIALILDVAAAVFDGPPLQLGGHDPQRDGFTLQQLEMNLSGVVDPFFRFDANLVFAQFGVEVEEAYVTTLALPGNLQARAGQFLARFGRINPTHPHSWSFADQPLVIGKLFGAEGSRGLGAELSWLSPLPWYVELVASAQDPTGECCARSFFGADDPGLDSPADLMTTLALKQFFPLSPAWSLSWGLSAQLGPNASGPDARTDIFGSDLYLRWAPVDDPDGQSVSLTVEALLRARQVPRDSLVDGGGYAQLVWRIDRSYEVGARYELVTGVPADPLDPAWTDTRTRAALQATWYPSHFSRLRLQGALDQPGWRPDPILAAFLALEVLVGAHPAHAW